MSAMGSACHQSLPPAWLQAVADLLAIFRIGARTAGQGERNGDLHGLGQCVSRFLVGAETLLERSSLGGVEFPARVEKREQGKIAASRVFRHCIPPKADATA